MTDSKHLKSNLAKPFSLQIPQDPSDINRTKSIADAFLKQSNLDSAALPKQSFISGSKKPFGSKRLRQNAGRRKADMLYLPSDK